MNYPDKFGEQKRFCPVGETGAGGMGRVISVEEKDMGTYMKRAFPTNLTDFFKLIN